MTSKELLEHIKNAPSFKGGDTRYTTVSNSATQYDADIKQIEQDLEVLEILKKIISQCSFEVGKEKYKSFYDDKYVYEIWIRQGKDMILLNLDEKEGEIMKEWIEK